MAEIGDKGGIMSNKCEWEIDTSRPAVYEIRIKGQLGPGWANWFEGLTVTLEQGGDTLLTGSVVDQAALYGLLKRVRDLGIPLVSVNRVESGTADTKGETKGETKGDTK